MGLAVFGPVAAAAFGAFEIPIFAAASGIRGDRDVEGMRTTEASRPFEWQACAKPRLAVDARARAFSDAFRQFDELPRQFRVSGWNDGIEAFAFHQLRLGYLQNSSCDAPFEVKDAPRCVDFAKSDFVHVRQQGWVVFEKRRCRAGRTMAARLEQRALQKWKPNSTVSERGET